MPEGSEGVATPGQRPSVFARLGLGTPELRAWATYDWANSAVSTTVVTAVFPPFYESVVAADLDRAVASTRFAFATTAALVVVALLAPLLGALADVAPVKKRMLGGFLALGSLATLGLAALGPGDVSLALVFFGLVNIGAAGSFVFYDALLPHIARPDQMDRVSTAGYALGYLGGGALLAVHLGMIERPQWFGLSGSLEAVQLVFASVALWWLGFSVPLFRRVPEPRALARRRAPGLIRSAVLGLAGTLRELRSYRNAFALLLAFLFYNDGIQTLARMAALFASEIGIPRSTLIGAILMVQWVGVPCAFGFGWLADRVGAKRAIGGGIAVYFAVSVFAYRLSSAAEFWVIAGLVALVQGGTQALSRSLFASMIPPRKSAEFFGLFSIFEKFAGIFGPLLFALAVFLTGSSRTAILSLIAFFAIGAVLLVRVDVAAGRAEAQR